MDELVAEAEHLQDEAAAEAEAEAERAAAATAGPDGEDVGESTAPSGSVDGALAPQSEQLLPASAADCDRADPEPTLEREVGRIAAERAAEERRKAEAEAAAEAAASKKKGKGGKGKKGDSAEAEHDSPRLAAPDGPFVPLPTVPAVRPGPEQSPLYDVVRDFVLRIAAAVPLASEASRVRAGMLPRGSEEIMDRAAEEAEERWQERVRQSEAEDRRIPRAEQKAHKAWALRHQADSVAEWTLPVVSENERHSSQGLRGADADGSAGSSHGVAAEVQSLVFGAEDPEGRMMRRVLRLVKEARGVEDDEEDDDSDDDFDDDEDSEEDEAEEPEGGDIEGYDASRSAAIQEADEREEAARKAEEEKQRREKEEAEAAAAGKGKKGKADKGKGKGKDDAAAADEPPSDAPGPQPAEPGPPLSSAEEATARKAASKAVSALLSNGASVIHRAASLFAKQPNSQRVVGDAVVSHALAHLHSGDAGGYLASMRGGRATDVLRLNRRAVLEHADVRGKTVVLRADLDLPLFPATSEEQKRYWSDHPEHSTAGSASGSQFSAGVQCGYEEEAEDDLPDLEGAEGTSVLMGGGGRRPGAGGRSVVSGMTKGTAKTAGTSATAAGGLKSAFGAGVTETPYVQPQAAQLARHPLVRALQSTVQEIADMGAACVVVVGRQGTFEPALPHR